MEDTDLLNGTRKASACPSGTVPIHIGNALGNRVEGIDMWVSCAGIGNYAERGGWGQLQFCGPIDVENESNERDVNMGEYVGNDGVPPIPRLRRRRTMQSVVTQFLQDSYGGIDEYESEDDDDITSLVDATDPRHIFKDEAWNQFYFTYDPPLEIKGSESTTSFHEALPTMLQHWEFFWPPDLMRRIVREFNCYVESIIDDLGNTMGSLH